MSGAGFFGLWVIRCVCMLYVQKLFGVIVVNLVLWQFEIPKFLALVCSLPTRANQSGGTEGLLALWTNLHFWVVSICRTLLVTSPRCLGSIWGSHKLKELTKERDRSAGSEACRSLVFCLFMEHLPLEFSGSIAWATRRWELENLLQEDEKLCKCLCQHGLKGTASYRTCDLGEELPWNMMKPVPRMFFCRGYREMWT